MLASGDQLLDLIPHRPPMIMADELLQCDRRLTRTSLRIKEANVFVSNGVFAEAGLIEMMAQAAAIGTGWRLRENAGTAPAIPAGVIAAVKNYIQEISPAVNACLIAEAEVLHEMEGASVIRGSISFDNKVIAQCEMNVFLLTKKD